MHTFKLQAALPTAALGLLAMWAVGCARWKDDTGGSALQLPSVRENSRSVIVDVEFVPIMADSDDSDASLWQWVDETAIDANARNRLIANGLRIGRLINAERFRNRVDAVKPHQDVVDQFLSAASVASEVSHNDKRIPMRLGRRYELLLRQPLEGDQVTMLRLDEETVGRTLSNPQFLFAMVAAAGRRTGEIEIRMRPEVHHGDTKHKWVSSDTALRIDTRRETWSIEALDVSLSGSEGDTFVIGANHPASGLARQMLGGKTADHSPLQIIVVIRIDQIPGPLDRL